MHPVKRPTSSVATAVADPDCRDCRRLPRATVTLQESHRLPRSWRPIDEHPSLRPGPWVPRGEMKGVVFCSGCGSLWLLFLDPAQDYYTDMVRMAPELAPLVSQDASLEQVLPLAVTADSLLQLMIRDWFALAHYDRSAAAEALVSELRSPRLSTRLAVRLLDFLAAVLAGSGRRETVRISNPSPLVALTRRDDLEALDPVRRASEIREIERLLAAIARAAFGSAFGADCDRLEASPDLREALLASLAPAPASVRRIPVLAPPGPALRHRLRQPRRLLGVEQLVSEIEDLIRDGAQRVTSQEIAPVVEVVRGFWEAEGVSGRLADPGLRLYRRCRDLLLALRHADLIPGESEHEVDEALSQT